MTQKKYMLLFMNTGRICFSVILFHLFLSCNHTRTAVDCIELGESNEQYNSVDEYCAEREANIADDFWLKLSFLNNPYNLGNENIVSVHVNEQLVYRGEYKQNVDLNGNPDDLFRENHLMIIRMEILTDKTKQKVWVHRFESKTVFSWNEDYKIIYCVFCPTNEDVENVFFIPHLETMK